MLLICLFVLFLVPISISGYKMMYLHNQKFKITSDKKLYASTDTIEANKLIKATVLTDWLISGGGTVHHNIAVGYSPITGYELRATGVIKPREVLCSVPKNLQFYSSSQRPLHDIAAQLSYEISLGPDSYYSPFLDCLPDDVSYIPAMWPSSRLNAIQGTTVAEDVIAMKNSWRQDALLADPNADNIENMMWARATVQGRACSFTRDAAAPLVSFLPFIMFANHDESFNGNAKYPYPEVGNGIEFDSSTVLLRSTRMYSAGQEVSISYGDISFQQKCTTFGWVDRSLNEEAFCITAVSFPEFKTTVEIKSPISSARKNAAGEKIALHDSLKVKNNLKEAARKIALNGEISVDKAFSMLSEKITNKIQMFSVENTSDELNIQNDSDLQYIKTVELEAALLLSSELKRLLK